MLAELRLPSKQHSPTRHTTRSDWASTYLTTHTELLVLTDFRVCLLVELVCCLFSGAGRRRKDWSSILGDVPAMGTLLTPYTLTLSQQACYMRTFLENVYRRYMEGTAGLNLTFICIVQHAIDLKATSFHKCHASFSNLLDKENSTH